MIAYIASIPTKINLALSEARLETLQKINSSTILA